MRTTALAALALVAVASTFATTPARADAPETNGLICQFASVADPTAEPGSHSGQVSGGPVLLTEQSTNPDLPGTNPETGTLVCRVQVNQGTHTGSGPDVRGHGTGVLTAGPGVINYIANATDQVFLCSEFVDDSDGVTYYWNDDTSEWTTDVNSPCGSSKRGPVVQCANSADADCPPYSEILLALLPKVCPILAKVSPPEGDVGGFSICPAPSPVTEMDPIVCPILAIVVPPEGDVVLPEPIGAVWDCPPYGT